MSVTTSQVLYSEKAVTGAVRTSEEEANETLSLADAAMAAYAAEAEEGCGDRGRPDRAGVDGDEVLLLLLLLLLLDTTPTDLLSLPPARCVAMGSVLSAEAECDSTSSMRLSAVIGGGVTEGEEMGGEATPVGAADSTVESAAAAVRVSALRRCSRSAAWSSAQCWNSNHGCCSSASCFCDL